MSNGTDPGVWGVATGYHDYAGRWREAPPATVAAILEVMGAGGLGEAGGAAPAPASTITVRTDRPLPPLGRGRIRLENGATIDLDGTAPAELPPGYHVLEPDGGEPRRLVVSPGRVPRPGARQWGFATQLYATRSLNSWGIGDLGDLRRLGEWAGSLGAGFTLVSPLHAPTPPGPDHSIQPSPYYPGSRCFLNPLHIAVAAAPGAAGLPGLEPAARAGRALNEDRRIDRDRVWSLKDAVLREAFARTADHPDFARYRAGKGEALQRFARYCATASRLGPAWREWPAGASDQADSTEVAYQAWLQWVAETQLAAAGDTHGLVTDLAVGVDPSGPDSWIWKETFAEGMRIGAPPDEFNTRGQDWGLPPFDPWRLRAGGYEPWIAALRANLTHCRGLRVDHVMGLFRLFWIPEGAGAAEGTYVSYPHHDLLNILALEAERAGAYVVGEDLGTVEAEVRADLAERQVLSYRLWWFEDAPPAQWPERAMAAVTTHDLPTVAGVLTGSDLEAQRSIGMEPNEEASAGLLAKLRRTAPGDGVEAAIEAVYADLATAPCDLLVATLEDALAVEDRPNMPGTTDQWPNWSIALPSPLEVMEKGPLPARLAEHLNRGCSA